MQDPDRQLELQRRLGGRVRELRQRQGWSQEELADFCGLHRTYVGSVERGERNVTISSLDTLAQALGVKISDVVKGLESSITSGGSRSVS